MRGGVVAARQAHNLKVSSSNLLPAIFSPGMIFLRVTPVFYRCPVFFAKIYLLNKEYGKEA